MQLFALEQSGWDSTYKTVSISKQILKFPKRLKASRILNIPPNLLLPRSKFVSIIKFSISEGILPVNLLAENDKSCSCLQLKKVDGIVPVK
jgi:hypothetical protein